MLLAYDFVGLSGLSTTLLWSVVGSGFALTGGGLIAATLQLDRSRRKVLAFLLFTFGIASLAPALFIAHVGLLLLVLAVPATVFGAIVGIMALPFPRLPSKRRLQ